MESFKWSISRGQRKRHGSTPEVPFGIEMPKLLEFMDSRDGYQTAGSVLCKHVERVDSPKVWSQKVVVRGEALLNSYGNIQF